MSHIPSAAMPHAQSHEHAPKIAPATKSESLPWAALVAGGVLAIGGAMTAAWLLRGARKPATPAPARRQTTRKAPTRTPAKRTARARKPRANAGDATA